MLRPVLRRLGSKRLPQHNGRVYLASLHQKVVIKRDRWGIPTIQASNRHDLFVAQGFVHAQERLWQMEIHRRAAAGTVAAVVGQPGLQTDRLSRTLGFFRLAEATWALASSQVRHDIQAYTDGVNAYLKNELPLPLEFSLLRHAPKPWSPLDSVACGRMIAWVLSHGFANKLTRAKLIEQVGPELAAELELFYPPENPVTLPEGIEFNLLEADGMLRAAEGPFMHRNMEGVGRGSNAWVVSGRRSASSQPLLCNDMHLPITTPSLWYVMNLQCRPFSLHGMLDVVGASLPGVPYVLVGHNDDIAWGATVSFVDSEDLFVEHFSPENATQYEFEGQLRQATVIEEEIRVRGRPNHRERVIVTHHGPLISKVIASNGQALALASRALEPSLGFDGFALLNEAKNWDGFVAAVRKIESPSLNLVYADRFGNIGYFVTGRGPIRRAGEGQVPVPGWTGEYEWIADIPFNDMPHALNPTTGLLVNANNKITGDDYPFYLGSAWRNGYRARRIKEFIEQRESVTLLDMSQLQNDLLSLPGLELRSFLLTHFGSSHLEDTDAKAALEILRHWDGLMEPTSTGALMYKTLVAELSMAILVPRIGRELADLYLGVGPHPVLYPFGESHGQWIPVLLRLLQTGDSSWLPRGAEKRRLIEQSLAQTMRRLRAQFGDDPARWSWGARHKIEFGHALAMQKPLDSVFSVGPFTVGGDADTVCQLSVSQGSYANNIAPSFRQIIDTSDWDTSLAMHAPGQSGHVASRHYGNLSGLWLSGGYYNLSSSQRAIDQSTHAQQELDPWPPGTEDYLGADRSD